MVFFFLFDAADIRNGLLELEGVDLDLRTWERKKGSKKKRKRKPCLNWSTIVVLQTRGAGHLGADHGGAHGRRLGRGQQARIYPCKWCTARTVLPISLSLSSTSIPIHILYHHHHHHLEISLYHINTVSNTEIVSTFLLFQDSFISIYSYPTCDKYVSFFF